MLPRRCVRTALSGILVLALLIPACLSAQTTEKSAEKLISLLKSSGLQYRDTKNPTVWVIPSTGDHLKSYKVIVAVEGDLAVVFVTVAEKRRLPVNTDFMRILLQNNHNLDRVKIGFDRDGDVSVRIDFSMRVTDVDEFRAIITQDQRASDELYKIIEPYLLAP
jgi:hypothetical protein